MFSMGKMPFGYSAYFPGILPSLPRSNKYGVRGRPEEKYKNSLKKKKKKGISKRLKISNDVFNIEYHQFLMLYVKSC